QPVAALELELDGLLEFWSEERKMAPISLHPPIYEDLAFVVDGGVEARQVQGIIFQTGKPLVRHVALFDVYRGEKLGEGKKSLAYALTYQAEDRTLADTDVAKVRQKIIQRVERETGATLRS
ncbi:MAG: phenylalanine--tRNA ligase subunit beta, partial [Deltaproteobacteria bacterium]|nr:phenylalanine--tRNA ligase subunit beta [Deltaproteobacteria bacterium]